MEKWFRPYKTMKYNYSAVSELQLRRGMVGKLYPRENHGCNYVSMQQFKLDHAKMVGLFTKRTVLITAHWIE